MLPQGTYDLTRPGVDNTNVNGDLDVLETSPDSLSIAGTGRVVIRSGGSDRVLHHAMAGDLEIGNVTITGGNAQGVADGGGILNGNGDLRLQGSTIRGNAAGVDGGGLTNYSTATLRNVTISGNATSNDGGGFYGAGGSSTSMLNVTIALNTADSDANASGDGGGIAGAGNISTFNTIIGDNVDSSPVPADKAPDCATGPGFLPRYTLIETFIPATCLVGFNPPNEHRGAGSRPEAAGAERWQYAHACAERRKPGHRRRGQRGARRVRADGSARGDAAPAGWL